METGEQLDKLRDVCVGRKETLGCGRKEETPGCQEPESDWMCSESTPDRKQMAMASGGSTRTRVDFGEVCLNELGEECGERRVAKLAQNNI